jgi:hypothetical protein
MESMIDAIDKLKQLQGPNFTDVCEKHTFECYRLLGDGCMQAVTVVIFDAGPNVKGSPRYFGHATSAEGRTVPAIADSSLDTMLASIRWSDLDPDPDPAKQATLETEHAPEKKDEFDRRDLFGMLRKKI